MSDIMIRCQNLSKEYYLFKNDFDRLKGFINPNYKAEKFVAVRDVSIEFHKGKIIGIIGINGSGKSTLSDMIAGIVHKTSGTIEVFGEVNILAANVGMENHLSGIENIDFKCTLLGFNSKEIDQMRDSIIEFADIGVHINQPLRTYSSGMRSRLGFAISIHMNPDILIIDEGLAVGDGSFYDKCVAKMDEIRKSGKTVIYISHAVTGMANFCDEIMWMHKGRVLGIEKPLRIIKPYCEFANHFASMTNDQRSQYIPTLEFYQDKFL